MNNGVIMLLIKNLTKYIGHEVLWDNLNFTWQKGDRVGLIGVNGCGKSTLLKVIIDLEKADEGSVITKNERLGYLAQELEVDQKTTVSDYLNLDNDYRGYKTLLEVGLEDLDILAEVDKLSGGQKTKLSLAKLLIEKPTILLMDEPTNHLDEEGIGWLEKFVRSFSGIVVVVTHDRKFLQKAVNRVVEIDKANRRVDEYVGNYDDYLREREIMMKNWQNSYDLQEKERKRLENWLALKRQEASVFKDPAKGRQVRQMEKRIEREIYQKRVARPHDFKTVAGLVFAGRVWKDKLIVDLQGVEKKFGERKILSGVDLEVRGQDRVLIAGDNGCGKTTLLKIMVGEVMPDGGLVRRGENLQYAYFSQELKNLDLTKDVLEEFLRSRVEQVSISQARAILGCFLFSGDDIYKPVRVLSFGERVRLIFAKMIKQENQLLILDEPTNHLDIPTREIIEQALNDYEGSMIVVSHDRYFVEQIGLNRKYLLENGKLNYVKE